MAVQANELRIGNYLIPTDCEYSAPFKIDAGDILEIRKGSPRYKYAPIPLSPDILLKCGCKQDAESKKYNYDDYVSNDLFVRIEKDRYQIVINKGHVIYMDAPYHLHQLQNLIHALTGQELNIKL